VTYHDVSECNNILFHTPKPIYGFRRVEDFLWSCAGMCTIATELFVYMKLFT
jgi:hypothetical protein